MTWAVPPSTPLVDPRLSMSWFVLGLFTLVCLAQGRIGAQATLAMIRGMRMSTGIPN
eukprot:CAMPEP_0179202658 /NCGR_PEP_ID=MMETSP0796-20121207/100952_1 /TAXON_ID=73915 /ORGANISM="Pyrodinium bahamense, Strain pbaha01" /LENGTH=56 /DNA_ID=CAMNT_0020907393 /DNA_START=42 /DNA_END=209 /DNA_ORIENTATION=-